MTGEARGATPRFLWRSVEMVERAPMIASLLRQMGLKIETALNPDSRLILDADQHTFNVFHVEHAQGNPSIPAQADFVRRYGIRSALGFGGLLPGGELFTIIMFSRVTIPRETADMFRTIALGVKLALHSLRPRSRVCVACGQRAIGSKLKGGRAKSSNSPCGRKSRLCIF